MYDKVLYIPTDKFNEAREYRYEYLNATRQDGVSA
jgi:hypothetical protein